MAKPNVAHEVRSSLARTAGLAGIALLLGAVVLAYFSMNSVKETLRLERLSLTQTVHLENLQALLKEAEAVQREYLITGDPNLLARFEALREKGRQRMGSLVASFEDPAARAAAPAMSRAFAERMQSMGDALRVRQEQGPAEAARRALAPEAAAAAALADLALDEARQRMQQLRTRRAAAASDDLGFLERGMLVGILVAGVLLGWAMQAGFRQEASRRAAEAALHAKSRELRLLVDAVPAAVVYVDPQERVLAHNRLFAQWQGLADAQIEGRTLREVLGAEIYEIAQPNVRRALAGERVHYERRHPVEGTLRDFAIDYVPHLSPGGAVLGYFGLLTDVTALKELSRMKSDFVSMVSHELRTPATTIRGALGMLAGGAAGALPAEAARLVGMANAGCEQLVRLVDDLANIERIEAGEIPIHLADHDLAQVLPLGLAAAGRQASAAGVRLQVRGDAPAAVVRTDADRVKQVLANLLANAIQFSPRGGVVQVQAVPAGVGYRITVSDQGPGVSPAMQPRLFQKFAQDPAMARGTTGRFGLGLATAKLLVERLGGKVGYDPAPGGGAQFWFELPRNAEAKAVDNPSA